MSVINKMLKDLDERQGAPRVEGRPVSAVRTGAQVAAPGHEWLWRILALLMLVALLWACWVAYQIWPRPIATELALKESFKPAVPVAVVHTPNSALPGGAPPAQIALPKPAAGLDKLKMATEITTPIRSAALGPPRVMRGAPPAIVAGDAHGIPPAPAPGVVAAQPDAQNRSAPMPSVTQNHVVDLPLKGSVDKRDRSRAPGERAEGLFRQAVTTMNQGRVSEAEELLVSALNLDPGHAAARQTYVAMLLEQGRIDAARRELQTALDLNPGQARFALPLARIQAERREYVAALEVLDKVPANAAGADINALRAAVLQRMGKHVEAITYFERSLKMSSNDGPALLGYGISLEAIGRPADAVQTYRRVLAIKGGVPEIRAYAEGRLRSLE